MHFVFKSTFIQILKSPPPPYAIRALLLNASTLLLILTLYMTNRLLPAVVAASPHGTLMLLIFGGCIAVKGLAALYTSVKIFLQWKTEIKLKSLFAMVTQQTQRCGYMLTSVYTHLIFQKQTTQSIKSPKQ